MHKVFTLLYSTLTAFVLFFPSKAPAENCCCRIEWCEGLEVGVDLLMWKPCFDLHYATSGVTAGVIPDHQTTYLKDHYLGTNWDPGLRVLLTNQACWFNWDFTASYTYFHSTSSAHIEGASGTLTSNILHAFINDSLTNITAIKANHKQQYHDFGFILSKDYCPCPCQVLTPFFGLQALYVDHIINHEITLSDSQTPFLDWQSNFWAVGIKMGLEATYDLCQCFSLYARGAGSFLVGEYDVCARHVGPIGAETPATDIHIDTQDVCLCLPGWHVSVGILFDSCTCGFDSQFRLGYEFLQWYGMPVPRRYVSDNSAVAGSGVNKDTFGFHGVLIGYSVSF